MNKSCGLDSYKVVDVRSILKQPWQRLLYNLLEWGIDPLLRISEFNAIHARVHEMEREGGNFFQDALSVLDIHYDVREEELQQIPKEGALITVSNHPFGSIDGVILGAILSSVRPDVKLLVNYLLAQMERIKPWIISVDPFGGNKAAKTNIRPMKEALKQLRAEGVLGLFPAGAVSHLHFNPMCIKDSIWNPKLAMLVRHSNATVLPIYFEGHNSRFFQMAGLIHPAVRTALLLREACNKKHRKFRVRIGNPILPSKYKQFETDRLLISHLRLKTDILKDETESTRKSNKNFIKRSLNPHKPLIDPVPQSKLIREVKSLPEESRLVQQGELAVYVADADSIPFLLREIGRLREQTFRAVGEGTGSECDLDKFDPYYEHLFLWDETKQELAGAYRIGRVDYILKEYGPKGLYSSTLFKFKPELIAKLRMGLEMGRSFVVGAYQRKPASLSLIWRGIGAYLARAKDYKILFGPVSISSAYQPISRDLIVTFLKENNLDQEAASLVKPKRPVRSQSSRKGLSSKNEELPLSEITEDHRLAPPG